MIEQKEHAGFSNALLSSAREICGETTGRRQRDRETWWWNEEVQLAVREKKVSKIASGEGE